MKGVFTHSDVPLPRASPCFSRVSLFWLGTKKIIVKRLVFCYPKKELLYERDDKMIEFEGFRQELESLREELLDLRDSL